MIGLPGTITVVGVHTRDLLARRLEPEAQLIAHVIPAFRFHRGMMITYKILDTADQYPPFKLVLPVDDRLHNLSGRGMKNRQTTHCGVSKL
jgi:hypothetical protein